MPCYFEFRCVSACVGLLVQHLPHPPMQVLSRGTRNRIVCLRSDQLVSKLEPAMHLAEEPLLLQPGQCFAGSRRRKLHNFVQGKVGEPPSQHGGQVEGRPCRRVEPPHLALEHGADGPRDADVRCRLRVEGLQIAQQRARAVRQPFLGQELERQRIAVAGLKYARDGHVRDPRIRFGDPRRH